MTYTSIGMTSMPKTEESRTSSNLIQRIHLIPECVAPRIECVQYKRIKKLTFLRSSSKRFFIFFFLAMKPHEIQEKLGLTRIRDRNWYVQPSCASSGDGLYEGLTWLTSNHKL